MNRMKRLRDSLSLVRFEVKGHLDCVPDERASVRELAPEAIDEEPARAEPFGFLAFEPVSLGVELVMRVNDVPGHDH